MHKIQLYSNIHTFNLTINFPPMSAKYDKWFKETVEHQQIEKISAIDSQLKSIEEKYDEITKTPNNKSNETMKMLFMEIEKYEDYLKKLKEEVEKNKLKEPLTSKQLSTWLKENIYKRDVELLEKMGINTTNQKIYYGL